MVAGIRGNGKMVRKMGLVFSFILIVRGMKGTGRTIVVMVEGC
jgi:hypothetical protein